VSDKPVLVLVGYSGHGYVVAEAATESGFEVKYYCDMAGQVSNPFQLDFLGSEKDASFTGFGKGYGFIMGIGENTAREKIADHIVRNNESLITIVHPHASISKTADLGIGVFVSRGALVNALATIGDYAILNTGCVVEHGCKLAKAVHIAPGAVLAGDVEIGERSFIGANSVIKQGITIGKDVVVGAGSVVIKDIADGVTYVGNPAKKINESK
jgi:sugar O-acyltransferase (sialic acid O-acetyltransferase NeuD family)